MRGYTGEGSMAGRGERERKDSIITTGSRGGGPRNPPPATSANAQLFPIAIRRRDLRFRVPCPDKACTPRALRADAPKRLPVFDRYARAPDIISLARSFSVALGFPARACRRVKSRAVETSGEARSDESGPDENPSYPFSARTSMTSKRFVAYRRSCS